MSNSSSMNQGLSKNELISQLHDIQLPEAPPGVSDFWLWISLIAILVALTWMAAPLLKSLFRRSGNVVNQLSQLHGYEPEQALQSAAQLMRLEVKKQVGVSASTQSGDAYLQQLDALYNTSFFSRDRGRLLVEGLYQPPHSTGLTATQIDAFLEDLKQVVSQ